MTRRIFRFCGCRGPLQLGLILIAATPGIAEEPARLVGGQFPSPMVEHTRSHPRLEQDEPPGTRADLTIGTLFFPVALQGTRTLPLLIHFHGATWLPQVAVAKRNCSAVIAVQLGSGSGTYAKPFESPGQFRQLLDEARNRAGCEFEPIVLSGWSAGYGAIRQILRDDADYAFVDAVLLIDGLHAGYKNGVPGPLESELVEADLDVFVRFAQDAVAGRKQFIITHSEVFPGTFASTTETTDYLLRKLELTRMPVLEWGPMGTQQLSEVRERGFRLAGYAGNSAPDHVDQLHALPDFLEWIEWAGDPDQPGE